MNSRDSISIGIDLGGTKLLVAVLDDQMTVIGRDKTKTPVASNGDDLVKLMLTCVKKALADAKAKAIPIAAVGVSIPGPIDRENGIVLDTVNIGVKNYPLREKLEKELEVPVVLENDVNAGVYGEFTRGAAQGFRHVVGIYPGTGVGGGLILDGRLYRGATGGAGEIGHMIIKADGRLCGCGQYGCLESESSKTALSKDLVALASSGKSPTILEKAGTDVNKIRSSVIWKAMKAGEPEVIRLVERSAWYLGIGMANCVNLFNPEIIVLGGGLIERFGDDFIAIADRSMRHHAMPSLSKIVKVVGAELGDDSVVTGAASLAVESLHG